MQKLFIIFIVLYFTCIFIYLFFHLNNKLEEFTNNEHIEHIIYINLDKRIDRKSKMEIQAEKYNLNIERFSAIQDDFGVLGCGLSHLNVLKLARERGYKNILILEDDFEFIVDKLTFEKEIDQIFNNNVEFDVLFLSYNLLKSEESEYPFLLRALDLQAGTGYIVNNHYYDKLINLYEESAKLLKKTKEDKYIMDIYWKKLQPYDKWYCVKNRIGKQSASFSNITGKYEDYNV